MNNKFKEDFIFEMYKDTPIKNSTHFADDILKKHGFRPSSSLYIRINKYQVEKYGEGLNYYDSKDRTFINNFGVKNSSGRRKNVERSKDKKQFDKFERRNSK